MENKKIIEFAKENYPKAFEALIEEERQGESWQCGFYGYYDAEDWLCNTVERILRNDQGSISFNMSLPMFRGYDDYYWVFHMAQKIKCEL